MKLFKLSIILAICVLAVSAFAENETPPEGKLSPLTMIRGDTAHIKIYGMLGGAAVPDDVMIWNDINIIKDNPKIKNINVFLNSLGGVASVGFSLADIFSQLEKCGYNISIYAYGSVASAAVLVFLSVENRYMGENVLFFVHEIRASGNGQYEYSRSDMKTMEDGFSKMTDLYVDMLLKRTKEGMLTKDDWNEMLKKDTWFTAQQAAEWGLGEIK